MDIAKRFAEKTGKKNGAKLSGAKKLLTEESLL